jgi:molybdenum cofactor biosynthesis enzyme MoaA
MLYDGYLDATDGWMAYGWAIDRDRPNEPVVVEYQLSSGYVGHVTADEFRADLLQNGVGDGRHAFALQLPLGHAGRGEYLISARIKGTSYELKGSPMRGQPRDVVGLVAGDIVNNCNLRCPFCVVDYSNIRGLKLMSPETFAHAAALMSVIPPGNFWLSCLHEPTLHPQLIEFIEGLPTAHRDRLSFTTNLSKRLPDGWLDRLANSGINHIRVSFDSRRPEIFSELRKGARYEMFEANLAQLTTGLRLSRQRPRLHFITMAFRENAAEIPDLIRYCHDELGGDSHEVRFMFYLPHLAHWGKEHILTTEEWARLETALAPLQGTMNLNVCGPIKGTREQFEHEQGLNEYIARENSFGTSEDTAKLPVPDPEEIGRQLPDEPIRLRLRWDGLLALDSYPEAFFQVNIGRIDDPIAYFERMRAAAKQAARAPVTGTATA